MKRGQNRFLCGPVLYWPSMSPDLAPIENVWQLLKMNLRRKKIGSYRSLVFGDKAAMEVLTIGISCKACTQYEQSNF